jgi:hypothetical protein
MSELKKTRCKKCHAEIRLLHLDRWSDAFSDHCPQAGFHQPSYSYSITYSEVHHYIGPVEKVAVPAVTVPAILPWFAEQLQPSQCKSCHMDDLPLYGDGYCTYCWEWDVKYRETRYLQPAVRSHTLWREISAKAAMGAAGVLVSAWCMLALILVMTGRYSSSW